MKQLLFLLSLLPLLQGCQNSFAQTPLFDPYISTSFSETQACAAGSCTRASAPASTAEGASLSGVDGYRVSICAASAQTLSGAGTMQGWWCDSVSSLCYRNTGLDQTVSASGVRCATFPDFKVSDITSNFDSVVFASSGVTVSGGSALTVRIYTHKERYK